MCPHKAAEGVTLEPSAESATIKVKVRLQSGRLLPKKTLYFNVITSVAEGKKKNANQDVRLR